MRNNHGFTMIEMVFVLAVTIVLASFGFTFHTPSVSDEDEIHLLSNIFNHARMQACALKEKQTVECRGTDLYVYDSHDERHITLANGFRFLTAHKFSYNGNGRIKTAKTIRLKSPSNKIYRFVFQVGSGTFYVQS